MMKIPRSLLGKMAMGLGGAGLVVGLHVCSPAEACLEAPAAVASPVVPSDSRSPRPAHPGEGAQESRAERWHRLLEAEGYLPRRGLPVRIGPLPIEPERLSPPATPRVEPVPVRTDPCPGCGMG